MCLGVARHTVALAIGEFSELAGFAVPTSVPGIEPHLLYPMKTWQNKKDFDETARSLVKMFQDNFTKFESKVDAEVLAAAPEVRLAAE